MPEIMIAAFGFNADTVMLAYGEELPNTKPAVRQKVAYSAAPHYGVLRDTTIIGIVYWQPGENYVSGGARFADFASEQTKSRLLTIVRREADRNTSLGLHQALKQAIPGYMQIAAQAYSDYARKVAQGFMAGIKAALAKQEAAPPEKPAPKRRKVTNICVEFCAFVLGSDPRWIIACDEGVLGELRWTQDYGDGQYEAFKSPEFGKGLIDAISMLTSPSDDFERFQELLLLEFPSFVAASDYEEAEQMVTANWPDAASAQAVRRTPKEPAVVQPEELPLVGVNLERFRRR